MSATAPGTAPPDVRLEVLRGLDDAEVGEGAVLAEAATEHDGVRPLSEQATLRMQHGGEVRHVLARGGADGALIGYAQVDLAGHADAAVAELVVTPAWRRRGVGRLLLSEALRAAPDGRLHLWAHGDHPGSRGLAAAAGLRQVRTLHVLRLSTRAPLPAPRWPDGVAVRTFEPGRDEQAWLRVNAAAFAHHPEQGAWTLEDLRLRMEEPWFDPAGFFLAERDGEVVGFHWTKVHRHEDGGGPIGEVYVVGVHPDQHGTGLGRALTLHGLRHLRSRGLPAVMLYVDDDNTAAMRLYESLGFTRWKTDVMYASTPAGA